MKLPSSRTTLPGAGDAGVCCGKEPGTLAADSGSFDSRRSANTRRASASPSRSVERVEEHRVLRLLAAVRAEPGRDERGRRDDVVGGERRRRNALRPVVAVDPGRVCVDEREDLRADGALAAHRVDLVREERLRLRARHEGLARQRERERVEAGHVERRHPRRAADELEEQPAIGRRHPAGAVRDIRLGLPVHVRDAELVAEDPHALARALALVPRLAEPRAGRA